VGIGLWGDKGGSVLVVGELRDRAMEEIILKLVIAGEV
jgi:hypothetical protein